MSPKTNLSTPSPSPSPSPPLSPALKNPPHLPSSLPHNPDFDSASTLSHLLPPGQDKDQDQDQDQGLGRGRGPVSLRSKRKLWLDAHPEYFEEAEEAAERDSPIQHDILIRRFQTAAERAGRGYAATLEADLWRAEAKRAAAMESQQQQGRGGDGNEEMGGEDEDGGNGVPRDKEEGRRMWRDVMEKRFLDGRDEEFEYGVVDEGEEGEGGWEERERVERWFEEEEEDGGEMGTGVLDF